MGLVGFYSNPWKGKGTQRVLGQQEYLRAFAGWRPERMGA